MPQHEGLVREKAVCRTKRYGNGEGHGLLDLLVAAVDGFETIEENIVSSAACLNS